MEQSTAIKRLEPGTPLVADLDINSSSTVHALALLRVGVFVPIRKTKIAQDRPICTADISTEFRRLEFARKEGFENISIVGQGLNFETDFKVWCGVVRAFNEHGYSTAAIEFKFTEFAKMCGFSSKRLDKPLRKRIHESLIRLRGQTISFSKPKTDKVYVGGLLSSASFDFDADIINLIADPNLWELYTIDHLILLKHNVLQKLQRSEVAQCLYVFLAALPKNPAPISFTRIRDRLGLTSSEVKEQNRTITNAIKKLKDIGFLQGEVITKEGERYLFIDKRCQKLTA